ncbi:hypothetical protein R1sor_009738 [Riccia sorocarpa]|uniref:F-box domain-containing protein n=1 Tax=Riccia sorocarpa TaxID=122646 RepID=A0ABD3HYQ6_9MARC
MEEVNADLDPEIWGSFPPELLQKVLAKLPLTSLLSCRSVSKEWKNLIETRVVYEGHPGKPILFYHHPCGRLVPGGPFLSPCLIFPSYTSNTWKQETLPFDETKELVAADGGLVCFSNEYSPDNFVIYNPLSKMWRELQLPSSVLPRLPRGSVFKDPFSSLLVGLSVNRDNGVYRLLVAGIHEDGPRNALMYDSSGTGSWKRCATVPPMQTTFMNGEWRSERGVCLGGNLYWHVYECSRDQIVKGIVKYSVENDVWAFVRDKIPCELPSNFHITAHDASILPLELSRLARENLDISLSLDDFASLGAEIKQFTEADNGLLAGILFDAGGDTHTPTLSLGEGPKSDCEIVFNGMTSGASRQDSSCKLLCKLLASQIFNSSQPEYMISSHPP